MAILEALTAAGASGSASSSSGGNTAGTGAFTVNAPMPAAPAIDGASKTIMLAGAIVFAIAVLFIAAKR